MQVQSVAFYNSRPPNKVIYNLRGHMHRTRIQQHILMHR